MEFDYYALYKDWTTLDLVRVARTPNDYAPEAVVVAKRILHERRVSLEEMDAAEWELAQAEMAAAIGKPRIGDYLERMTEVFRPERGRAYEATPRWYTVLLVLYGIYYIFNIYSVIKYLVYLRRCENCLADRAGQAWKLCLAVYITACIYLLLKKKSAAWAMLVIQAIVLSCAKFSLLFFLYERHFFDDLVVSMITSYVLPILFYAAFGYFLWRPHVVTLFHITKPVKDWARLIGISIGILAMATV
jgi:hypothetical protein